jgi:hypothetical protein
MGRIQIPDSAAVAEHGYSTPFIKRDNTSGLEHVAQAVNEVGKGLDNYVKTANAVAANDAVTQYQHDNVSALDGSTEDGQPSFLSREGKDAIEKSGPTLEWLEKRRQDIAAELTNDEQRKVFLHHSAGVYESSRARIESHASQQLKVTEDASLQGRMATSLLEISKNYTDAEGTSSKTAASVENTIRAFKAPMGQAAVDAAVGAWREKVAETRLNQYLDAKKDWAGAEQLFATVKDDLGPNAARYQVKIDDVKRDGVADAIALHLVAGAAGKGGRVNGDAALAALDAQGLTDIKLKDEARLRLQHYVTQAEQGWKAETEKISKEAFADYNTGGWPGIDSELKKDLNARNPELYHQLKADSERKFRERNASGAAARKEQADRNKEALNNFMSLPAAERAKTDPAEFALGRGVDPLGVSDIKRHQRGAIEMVDKGLAVPSDKFVREAVAAGQGIAKGKTAQAQLKAEATLEFANFYEKNKRAPSVEEATKLTSHLVGNILEPGYFYGTNEKPLYQHRAEQRAKGIEPDDGAPAPESARPPGAAPVGTLAVPAATRTPSVPLSQRYVELKKAGKSAKEIADTLNTEGYKKGGK